MRTVHMRKLKTARETSLPSPSEARLKELIEEAVVDAYTEEEQAVGFFTMIEEHLALPFTVKIQGVAANVEKIDMTPDNQIVAICHRGKTRQEGPGSARASASWGGMDSSLSPVAERVLGERIPVLRFSSD